MADIVTRGERPFFQAIYDLASPPLDRKELDRRAAAVVNAYSANADELSRLAVDGSIPGGT